MASPSANRVRKSASSPKCSFTSRALPPSITSTSFSYWSCRRRCLSASQHLQLSAPFSPSSWAKSSPSPSHHGLQWNPRPCKNRALLDIPGSKLTSAAHPQRRWFLQGPKYPTFSPTVRRSCKETRPLCSPRPGRPGPSSTACRRRSRRHSHARMSAQAGKNKRIGKPRNIDMNIFYIANVRPSARRSYLHKKCKQRGHEPFVFRPREPPKSVCFGSSINS